MMPELLLQRALPGISLNRKADMDDLKECREEFEAWQRGQQGWLYNDEAEQGTFQEDRWIAWQAAWNRRAVPQANAEQDAQDKIDAARYRYLRDTETLETAVWEALEGSASVTDSGVLDHAGYRAEFDRAIDAAIRAASKTTPSSGEGSDG